MYFAAVNVTVARPDYVIAHFHKMSGYSSGIKGGETEDDPLSASKFGVQHDEFSVIGVVGHRQGDEHGVAVLVDRASCHRRTLDSETSHS